MDKVYKYFFLTWLVLTSLVGNITLVDQLRLGSHLKGYISKIEDSTQDLGDIDSGILDEKAHEVAGVPQGMTKKFIKKTK